MDKQLEISTKTENKVGERVMIRSFDSGEPRSFSMRTGNNIREWGNESSFGRGGRDEFVSHNLVLTEPVDVGNYIVLPDKVTLKVVKPSEEAAKFIESTGGRVKDSVFVTVVPEEEWQGKDRVDIRTLPLANETRKAFGWWMDEKGKEINNVAEKVIDNGLTGGGAREIISSESEEARKKADQRREREEAAMTGMDTTKIDHGSFAERMAETAAKYLQTRSAIRNGVAEAHVLEAARKSIIEGVNIINDIFGKMTAEEKGYASQALVLTVMRTMHEEYEDQKNLAACVEENRRKTIYKGEKQSAIGRWLWPEGSTSARMDKLDQVITEQVLDFQKRESNYNVGKHPLDMVVNNIRVLLEGDEATIFKKEPVVV